MAVRQIEVHQEMRRWLRPVERVIAGRESGRYSLPEELITANERLWTIRRGIGGVALPPDPTAAAAELAANAAAEEQVPGDLGKKLLKAESRFEEARAQLQVLRLTETQTARQLRDLFDYLSESMVVEHLRPALDEVLAEVGKLAPKLNGATTPEAIFRLEDPTAARQVWFDLEAQATRYGAIRAAYDALFSSVFEGELAVSGADLRGRLEYRNFHELPRSQGRLDVPSEQAGFMIWLVSSEPRPEPWLPLPDEVEGALRADRERVREQQQWPRAAGVESQRREMQEQEAREAKAEPFGGWRQ
jgi:hypothetical protein